MTTFVGTQADFIEAVKELIELDFDAIEAYETAIEKFENIEYKTKFTEFRKDHQRHIDMLSEALTKLGHTAPSEPSSKQWLTKGKVIMVGLLGDKAILNAMLTNEEDTNTAYERMKGRKDQLSEVMQIIADGLEDEKRHKAWIKQTIDKQG